MLGPPAQARDQTADRGLARDRPQRPDLLDEMRDNPRDWRMADIETLCAAHGISCKPPTKGSHYKVKHCSQVEILTIPSDHPIKPVYIRKLVKFVAAVIGDQK